MATSPPAAPARRAYDHTYPGSPEQALLVRADLAAFLGDCPRADDAILCASELAANAIQHSRSGRRGGDFTLRAHVHEGDHVWVEIEDNGGNWIETAHHDGRGHGLAIVRALAGDCGIDGGYTGRAAWFRLNWTIP